MGATLLDQFARHDTQELHVPGCTPLAVPRYNGVRRRHGIDDCRAGRDDHLWRNAAEYIALHDRAIAEDGDEIRTAVEILPKALPVTLADVRQNTIHVRVVWHHP